MVVTAAAAAGAAQPAYRAQNPSWGESIVVATFGGPSDTLNATLNGEDVSSPAFGIGFSVVFVSSDLASATAVIDFVEATVHYCE